MIHVPVHILRKDKLPVPDAGATGFPYSHYILLDDGKLSGMIPREDIPIPHSPADTSFFFAGTDDTSWDVFRKMALHGADIIPVVQNDMTYLGYYVLDDILDILAESPMIGTEATTIIVEKEKHDISFSEISQIIESEQARLLGMFILDTDGNSARVLVRFTGDFINEIAQSFRRYDYKILNDNIEDFLREQLKERSDYLQKYLEI